MSHCFQRPLPFGVDHGGVTPFCLNHTPCEPSSDLEIHLVRQSADSLPQRGRVDVVVAYLPGAQVGFMFEDDKAERILPIMVLDPLVDFLPRSLRRSGGVIGASEDMPVH